MKAIISTENSTYRTFFKKNLCQADMLTAYCADNEIDVKYITGNDVYL